MIMAERQGVQGAIWNDRAVRHEDLFSLKSMDKSKIWRVVLTVLQYILAAILGGMGTYVML